MQAKPALLMDVAGVGMGVQDLMLGGQVVVLHALTS